MKRAAIILLQPTARPFSIMIGAILVLALMDRGSGYFFSLGTVFSVMQLFATFGLVALGLGLSMLIREFDLSVAGMVGLAGCIAVMTGASNPWLGLLLGVGAGVVSGLLQGLIMTRLGLSSVGVTLGGLLTLQGFDLRAEREQDHRLSQPGGGARAQRPDRRSPVGAELPLRLRCSCSRRWL